MSEELKPCPLSEREIEKVRAHIGAMHTPRQLGQWADWWKKYCKWTLQFLERTPDAGPQDVSRAELLEEYERAKEEAVETCLGAHNSYGCGYDSGYREGIRWALYRGDADGK